MIWGLDPLLALYSSIKVTHFSNGCHAAPRRGVPYMHHYYRISLQDLKSIVEQVAVFLGYSFTNDVIDGIVQHCTFKNMKTNPQTDVDTLYAPYTYQGKDDGQVNEDHKFFRKGI